MPTFVCRVGDHATRTDWDAALTAAVAAHTPDLVVSAGFMKILGADFLAVFGNRCLNTHPALLPAFPGAHGVRDALAYGVRVTGCTVHLVDAGVDTGPIVAQAAVAVRDDDDEDSLHERIKTVERELLSRSVGRMAREGFRSRGPRGRTWRHRQGGELMESQMSDGRRPVRRALISVYDKTGLAELAQGLHAAGVAMVSTGSTAARIADAGRAGDQGRGPHRLPGVPRRPREDAAPAGARRDPGRPAPGGPRRAARRARRRAVRAGRGQPLPVQGHRRLRRHPGRVRRADRHRRAVDGARRRQEPPERRRRRRPGPVRRRARRRRRGRLHPGRASPARGRGLPAHRRVRRRRRLLARLAVQDRPGVAVAELGRRDLDSVPRCCATARTRTSRPRSTSPMPAGWPRPSSCTARRCPTTTTSTPTPRVGPPTTSPSPCVAIIKHANPCGIAIGADIAEAHRKAHECDPVSAFGGVIAANRTVTAAMAEQVAEIFTEVICAPDFEPAALEILRAKKNLRLLTADARRSGPGRGVPSDLRRGAAADRGQARRPRRRPGQLDAGLWRAGLGRNCSSTCSSPGAPSAG